MQLSLGHVLAWNVDGIFVSTAEQASNAAAIARTGYIMHDFQVCAMVLHVVRVSRYAALCCQFSISFDVALRDRMA